MPKLVTICTKCGSYNSLKYTSCIACGKSLPKNAPHVSLPTAEEKTTELERTAYFYKKRKQRKTLLFILFCPVLISILLFYTYILCQNRPAIAIPLFVLNDYLPQQLLTPTLLTILKSIFNFKTTLIAIIPLAALLLFILYKLHKSYTRIIKNERYLQKLANTDELTGLNIHRYFIKILEAEFKKSKKNKTPLSLAMVDIDHFKQINDTYGHEKGNIVLTMIAEVMRNNFRKKSISREGDILARYGGEEFCIVFLFSNSKMAYIAAERFRQTLQNTQLPQIPGLQVTASIGIASLKENSLIKNVNTFIECADKALYHSKQNGRNQTTIYTSELEKK